MKKKSVRELVLLIPRPLRKFVRSRLLPSALTQRVDKAFDKGTAPKGTKNATQAGTVRWYDDRLWGGFSEDASAALQRIKTDPKSSAEDISSAARALAVWHASHDDFEQAYPEIVLSRIAQADHPEQKIQVFIETDCLLALGENKRAADLVDAALKQAPLDACYLLTKANTFLGTKGPVDGRAEAERLRWINRAFASANFAPLAFKDPTRPLALDNISGNPPPCFLPYDEQPLVSVLVAAYNAESTLRFALESILAQSWSNLEIILVDDVSTDGTYELALEMSRADARLHVEKQEQSRGAYAARNRAFRRSRGAFITLQDADDWSHPQKLEVQMRHLLANPQVPANCSDWVRCYSDLRFRNTARVRPRRVHMNFSSILVRREVVTSLGGWDEVRAAGDNEFIRRLERAHQLKVIDRAGQGAPLAFALEQPGSLTRTKSSHVLTVFHGVRRTYQESAFHWMDVRGSQESFRLRPPSEGRTFPAPYELTRQVRSPYDLLVIMDYQRRGDAADSMFAHIEAAIEAGKRVAVFHWRRFEQDVNANPGSRILDLAQQGRIYVLPPGGQIDVETVVVGDPLVLKSRIDLPPDIKPKSFLIVANVLHARSRSAVETQYDPLLISQNVLNQFGMEPKWVAVSTLTRDLMISDGRYRPINDSTWTPLIDLKQYLSKVPYRGGKRVRPIIGRHTRDHQTTWPSTASALKAAYCSDQNADVHFLGTADFAKKLAGSLAENWRVVPRQQLTNREFLLSLDYYVYHPHEDCIEPVCLGVLEAMAVGLPVILPPIFESTFEGAARYAEPDEVWSVVASLWEDESKWKAQSTAALEYVQANSHYALIAHRLGAH